MVDYEKLGVFYLGKLLDPAQRELTATPYLYDAKDLTTHAIVIGMTGSGKTGLCLNLLEEAAIDNIPAIAIDPKGDIGNLLLTFPNLAPEDFAPWIDPAEAARQEVSVEEYALKTAESWRKGLGAWDQDASRIERLRANVDLAIYTPGSNAGFPVSLLRSFAVPPAAVMEDGDAYRQRVGSEVAGLLALLGMGAEAFESREHILLSTILDRAWKSGQDMQIPLLLRQIQQPPFDKVGFLDLESFFPTADRFALVTRLNNLFASPAFSGWMEGEPLDVGRLLYTSAGKPRISIMSIAHLSDAERMFFVTILLNEVLSWMRTQPGTSSLRAILYMDEIFGYFPPTANPPSKTPMLTLLKQARAYGVGVVLATQNPVDLDYKGMANTGTWFLGRLQTERDKQRVLDGLEGASTAAGFHFDRAKVESTLSGLAGRTFLVNNVHEDAPVLFQTRWALSYLRGPLTREQIGRLMKDKAPPASTSAAPSVSQESIGSLPAGGQRPMVPPGVEEWFLSSLPCPKGHTLVYRPALVGLGQAHFINAKLDVDLWEKVAVIKSASEELSHPAWEGGRLERSTSLELTRDPEEGIPFASPLAEMLIAKNYSGWGNEFKQYMYQHLTLTFWRSARAKLTSNVGESEGDFRVRVRQALAEMRDQAIEKLRAKYAPKLARIDERMRKAQQRIEKEKGRANQSTLNAVIALASSVLAAIFGRKKVSVTNVGRASTTMRSAGQVLSKRGDVSRAEEDLDSLEEEFKGLEDELAKEVEKIKDRSAEEEDLTKQVIRPRKSDLTVTKASLLWSPWHVDAAGIAEPAFAFTGTVPSDEPATESDE